MRLILSFVCIWLWMTCAIRTAKAQIDYELPIAQCLPPTPQAAALLRYVDFPVSTATGIPEISIPVHTIRSGDLQMPISLSYHASGTRSNDRSTNVGFGWNLNCGGAITRVVKGLPDTGSTYVPMASEITSLEYIVTKGYNTSMRDTNYDSYCYSFNGSSGEFMVHPNTFEITQLTPSENKIEAHSDPDNIYGPDKITITTPDGTTYEFADQEYVATEGYKTISSWYLSKIVNYNRTDSLVFSYGTELDWVNDSSVIEIKEYCRTTIPSRVYPISTYYSNCKRLSTISYRSGQIDFEYTLDRNESGAPKSRLVNIKCKDSSGRQIVRAELDNNDSFPGPRLKLRGIRIVGQNDEVIDQRRFGYLHETENVPLSGGCDLFGYYNGRASIANTREYSFYNASTFVLDKIEQPTGGYTRFTYEPNTIRAGVVSLVSSGIGPMDLVYDTISLGIGIRIAEIETYDGTTGKIFTHSYEYDDTIATIDFSKVSATCYLSSYNTNTSDESIISLFSSIQLSSSSSMPDKSIEGTRLYHCRVTEKQYGNTQEQMKIVYTYAKVGDQFSYQDTDASWFLPFDTGQLKFLSIYHVGSGSNPFVQHGIFADRGYFPNVDWMYGSPLEKKIYTLEDGQYRLVETTTYDYKMTNSRQIVTGFYCQISKRQDGNTHPSIEGRYYFNIVRHIGRYLLQSTSVTKKLGTGELGELRDYTYAKTPEGVQTGMPRTETLTINGTLVHTKNHVYPFDNSDFVSSSLLSANRLAPPLQTTIIRNGETIATQSLEYERIDDVILPRFIRFLKNRYDMHRQDIHNYDTHFNPACISLNDQPKTVYIWSYHWSEPVAEIRNASYEDVLALDPSGMLHQIGEMHDLSEDSAAMYWLKGLRQHLPDSQITLYTYRPGIGITSINDPSGRLTYYEYDGANRLKTIRDEEGNILESYEYHYCRTE